MRIVGFNKKSKYLLMIGLCLSVSQFIDAQVKQTDIAAALTLYPLSRAVEQQNTNVVDYPIAMGEMKKSRGLWAPENERRLAGVLQRLTVQIPEGHSPQEAFSFYFQKFIDLNARVLFHCEQRSCGASNAWANELFHIKLLYGLDQQQSYAAFELIDDLGKLHFVSIYTVIRGNKRVYAHTEWLATELGGDSITPPSAEEISKALQTQGVYFIDGVSIVDGKLRFDPSRLQTIVEVILSSRRTQLKIVGRELSTSNSEGGSAGSVETMTNHAQQFLQLLTNNGIPAQRLSAEVVNKAEFFNNAGDRQEGLIKIELLAAN